ncbi:MAG: sulfatase-like hydrolase/transferase [Pirellulaceae bacterium]|nr:sulfatase-like hydrolase/transferase [Pirellulaceae bacterium]
MQNRLPLALLFAFLSFILGTPCDSKVCADARPNILWITSEDHGPEMGCYDDLNAKTPNVDALARNGMIFNRAWSCVPVCAPARTAIITGMYPSSTGGIHMRSMVPMPAGAKMFPQILREAGYYCSNNSKEDYNVIKPSGVWDDSSARAHWRGRAKEQPFFAVFNSTKSHESQIRTRPHDAITNPAEVRVPIYHPDTPEIRQDWAQYYDTIGEADTDAGKVLRDLADDGLFKDTIIFYYGDHGGGMPRSKRWPSNSGLHVPLVVYFPEKWKQLAPSEYRPGGKSERMVNFVDLAPTVLSLAGIKPPEIMQGDAFAGPFQEEPPEFLFGERGRMDERLDVVRTVTDGRHVYIRNFYPIVSQGQRVDYQFQTPTTRIWRDLFARGDTIPEQSRFWEAPKAPEELYDLKHDRDEVTNLVGRPGYKHILDLLREVNLEHLEKIRDVCLLPEGEMHSRSNGSSPYDMARDESKYPFERILSAADISSNYPLRETAELLKLLEDSDSAVRYWAALGLQIRGSSIFTLVRPALQKALNDSSPYVRIVAAQTLIDYGSIDERKPALEVLGALAPPDKNGIFVSMAALNAIESLGIRAVALVETVKKLSGRGPSPDSRYDSYVPRLIQNILGSDEASRKANTPSK